VGSAQFAGRDARRGADAAMRQHKCRADADN
jgi:hypothetical protein